MNFAHMNNRILTGNKKISKFSTIVFLKDGELFLKLLVSIFNDTIIFFEYIFVELNIDWLQSKKDYFVL